MEVVQVIVMFVVGMLMLIGVQARWEQFKREIRSGPDRNRSGFD